MKSKFSIILLALIFVGIIAFSKIVLTEYTSSLNSFTEDNDKTSDADKNDLSHAEDGKVNDNEKEEENIMNILELTNENFEDQVLKSEKTVLIDFYADWCGPCKMMAPVVEKIAEENSNIKVGKVNIDEESELAIKYGVMSIPTFIVIKNGEVVNRIVGAVDKSELENAIGG